MSQLGTDTSALSRVDTDPHYDETKRYLADNMWTHTSFDKLWPNLEEMLKDWPPAPTHLGSIQLGLRRAA